MANENLSKYFEAAIARQYKDEMKNIGVIMAEHVDPTQFTKEQRDEISRAVGDVFALAALCGIEIGLDLHRVAIHGAPEPEE